MECFAVRINDLSRGAQKVSSKSTSARAKPWLNTAGELAWVLVLGNMPFLTGATGVSLACSGPELAGAVIDKSALNPDFIVSGSQFWKIFDFIQR